MSPPPDAPHDQTRGTFEDTFLYRFLSELGGSLVAEFIGLLLRVLGWVFWQMVRLVCSLISNVLSAWHS